MEESCLKSVLQLIGTERDRNWLFSSSAPFFLLLVAFFLCAFVVVLVIVFYSFYDF